MLQSRKTKQKETKQNKTKLAVDSHAQSNFSIIGKNICFIATKNLILLLWPAAQFVDTRKFCIYQF